VYILYKRRRENRGAEGAERGGVLGEFFLVAKINIAESDIDDEFAEAATIIRGIVAKGKFKIIIN